MAKDGGLQPLDELLREKHYRQTYVILNPKGRADVDGREVLFCCGNWSYRGVVQFNGLKVSLKELPVLIASLQKQQGILRYYANSNSIPVDSYFHEPLQLVNEAANFFGQQMTSEETEDELNRLSKSCPWINDDSSTTYFELSLDGVPKCMDNVSLIASKTYVRGLIIISVYFEGCMYYMLQAGEGDQALLDVRFPDITRRGQGMHLASYSFPHLPFSKLTLWLLLDGGGKDEFVSAKELPKIRTISVSSRNYQQTYLILKSAWEGAVPQLSVHHDVLFRFGSWCYAGRVQLIPSLSLGDLPFVIPALRMQQSRLEYLCDAGSVPTTSAFSGAMDFIQKHEPIIEQLIEQSSDALTALIERLNRMGVGEAVSQWLEGDPKNSFFEFKMHPDEDLFSSFNALELVASKSYHASGIITTLIMYQYTIYVCLADGSKENPLLDSSFPDIAGKGRGYQISAYPEGIPEWPSLRKVSVWQTVAALEQEFNSRAAAIAQGKGALSVSVSSGEIGDLIAGALDYAGASAKGGRDDDDQDGAGTGGAKAAQFSSSSSSSARQDAEAEEGAAPAMAEAKQAEDAVLSSYSANAAKVVVAASSSSSTAALAAAKGEKADEDAVGSRGDDGFSSSSSASAGAAVGAGGATAAAESKALPFNTPGKDQFSSTRMARPHHLPKMESLSRKLDEIKKSMGDGDADVPWDASGRPVLGGSSKK